MPVLYGIYSINILFCLLCVCEYLAETDLPRAINLLNTLKIARGAAELNTSLTKDEFLDRMYMDATRESIAEGQTFYLYKRLNRICTTGNTRLT